MTEEHKTTDGRACRAQTLRYLLKCPYCGGAVNHYQALGIIRGRIVVLVECWSGNTSKEGPHHLFVVKLKLKTLTRNISTFEVADAESPSMTEAAKA